MLKNECYVFSTVLVCIGVSFAQSGGDGGNGGNGGLLESSTSGQNGAHGAAGAHGCHGDDLACKQGSGGRPGQGGSAGMGGRPGYDGRPGQNGGTMTPATLAKLEERFQYLADVIAGNVVMTPDDRCRPGDGKKHPKYIWITYTVRNL
jgi:hypothetical protein